MSNVVLLCGKCHRFAHSRPVAARAEGFIIPTWEQRPTTEIPVSAFYGAVTLDDEGGVTWVVQHTA